MILIALVLLNTSQVNKGLGDGPAQAEFFHVWCSVGVVHTNPFNQQSQALEGSPAVTFVSQFPGLLFEDDVLGQ